jgi:acetylornithine deacetylase/succinyl-diaminopimelate desuccinylase-like protein
MTGQAAAPVVGLLQELIRNGCVNDGTRESGHEERSVATLADFFGEPGRVVEPAPGRQSVIYRVPGTRPGAPRLLLLPHLDVVPATPDGWDVDPFAAEIADGFVWGRGTVDMLNLTAAMAVVFARYLRGELPPLPGDLILAAVADEENSGTLGARHLVEERWDLVAAEYLLTEVAYPPIPGREGLSYPVVVGEKGPFWTRLTARGTPGHGSLPYQTDNAIAPLSAALLGLFESPSPVAITDLWQRFAAILDLDPEMAQALVDPERIGDAIDRLAAIDPGLARYAHAVTHLTVSPNLVQAGIKANIVAERAEATIDLRALPGMDRDFVDAHLRKAMGHAGDRLQISPIADFPATTSPTGNPLWQAIEDSLQDLTGSRMALEVLTPVATDARFFRRRGTVAYGVGLFDDRVGFPEFLGLFHGHNERVSVESLHKTVDMLSHVVARFGELTS